MTRAGCLATIMSQKTWNNMGAAIMGQSQAFCPCGESSLKSIGGIKRSRLSVYFTFVVFENSTAFATEQTVSDPKSDIHSLARHTLSIQTKATTVAIENEAKAYFAT